MGKVVALDETPNEVWKCLGDVVVACRIVEKPFQ
jgi:hypothetical protein